MPRLAVRFVGAALLCALIASSLSQALAKQLPEKAGPANKSRVARVSSGKGSAAATDPVVMPPAMRFFQSSKGGRRPSA